MSPSEGAMRWLDACGQLSDLWIAIGQLAVPARRFWHGDTLGVRRPGWTVSWLGSGGDGDTDSGPVARTTIRCIFRDVYVPAALPLTHEVRCEGAAVIFP